MKCPVCKEPTFVVEYNDIELDLCPTCKGTWFDAGELELLLGGSEAVDLVAADSDEKARHCPVCPKTMEKVNIGPERRVIIDACPAGCGLWFDDKELHDLTHDLQSDGWHVRPEVRDFLCGFFPE